MLWLSIVTSFNLEYLVKGAMNLTYLKHINKNDCEPYYRVLASIRYNVHCYQLSCYDTRTETRTSILSAIQYIFAWLYKYHHDLFMTLAKQYCSFTNIDQRISMGMPLELCRYVSLKEFLEQGVFMRIMCMSFFYRWSENIFDD